jgi:glycosyltransferase involved in cell wall biosynthesis
VRQDMNGFLFNPGDIGAISEALCQVFLNDHLQAAMSQKSLEYIREHDIKNTVESFERIYKQFHTSRPAVKVVKLFNEIS